jgi:predicted metal-dependent enzyme (double-stranded beta helix superfamily)
MTLLDTDEFVASCVEASKAADPVSALRIQVERAIADTVAVERRFPVPLDPDDDGILHRSTDLLITCAIFPRGFATGIHDHSVPAIIGLWAGSEENRLFRRTPTGIEMTGSQRVRSGEVIVLEADAIHDVRVSTAGWSGGLHVYLGDILEVERSEWIDEASTATRFDPEDQERRWTVAAESTGLVAQPSASAP